MTSFPMPDLASNLAEFITATTNYISLINQHHFLEILGALALAVTVITWAVGRVKDPPDFWRQ